PRAPPMLHSSPTRRSSDLHQVVKGLTGETHGLALVDRGNAQSPKPLRQRIERRANMEFARHIAAEAQVHNHHQARAPRSIRIPTDRKSTRLNSSHVKISYA